jgi:hypothetical protein
MLLSPTYKGVDIDLSNSNQTALQQLGSQQSVLGQTLINKNDKVMFSVQSNVCTTPGNPFFQSIGIGTTLMNYYSSNSYPGNDGQSVGFSMDGYFYYSGSIVQSSLPTWTTTDIIDVAVDASLQLIWLRVMDGNWNNNASADPAVGTGGLPLYGLTSFYPVLSPGNDSGQMTILHSPYFILERSVPEGFQFAGSNQNAAVGFLRSQAKTDASFVSLVNNKFGQLFLSASASVAKTWLNTNGYWTSYGISFTITSSDFTNGSPIDTDTTALGTSGFINTASQNDLIDGYYGQGLTGTSLSELTSAYNDLGLALNNSVGRLWYVTWGSGSSVSSGIVKFGAYVNGGNYFDIQPIDTTDPNYLSPNNSQGTSLTGTFLFPATFTIYEPVTNKGGWC